MLEKIISGGQTGADRAALDAALANDFPTGGHCPAGRRAEDGRIDDKYPLIEITGGYKQRTKKNVISADGTAIFYRSQLSGGSELTRKLCIKDGMPHIGMDSGELSESMAAKLLVQFIEEYQVRILNVAGPRVSNCPEIYDYVREALTTVIKHYSKWQCA